MVFKVFSLLSTVVVLFSMTLFLLASLPLLVLKHDDPRDARFVRGLFNLYYTALAGGAIAGTASYALLGNYLFCAGMATLALLALLLRRWMLPQMDALRAEMSAHDKERIGRFRKLHMGGMLVNFVQLGGSVAFLQQLAI